MGEVYRAHDARLGRDVAIKTIAPRFAADPDTLARFQREARVIASLNHPNVVAIYDIGSENGVWYLVTELLSGETVRERLARGAVPWRTAVQIVAAVADGLTAAHAGGVVHRDLKPANVFLTADGRVKILDFGLARQMPALSSTDETQAQSGGHTVAGIVVGTVGYMSPEQARGLEVDIRSDLFSLGCLFYEMLRGRRPFAAATPLDALAALLNSSPALPVLTDASAPAALEQAVLRCLEKDRAMRFQSAAELAATLQRLASGSSPSAAVQAPRDAASVAVLPFLNLSTDKENEFFADGITEDVIAHLSKIRALKVISRTSVMAFKTRDRSLREIGQTLGVKAVVDGSVRRAGQRVRIVAQLVDTQDDTHLWGETYDRELTDIFAIQTDVALQIAAALRTELSADERTRIHKPPTQNLQAYQLYLQGRYQCNRYTESSVREGLRLLERALAIDPNLAPAHVELARMYAENDMENYLPVQAREGYARAKQAVTRALELDSSLGVAHGIVGLLAFAVDFDWAGAERAFKTALSLSPGSADVHCHYGWMCSAQRRFDDALRCARRARELDPIAHRNDVAGELLRAGQYEAALTEALELLEVEPDYARAHATCGWAYILSGRTEEGVASIERALSLGPSSSMVKAQLGQAYAMAGQRDKAQACLDELSERAKGGYVPPYHFAYIHTGLGDADRAMDYLEQAYETRAGAIYGINGSFLFASLRSNPRFQALLKKMNLLVV